LGRPAVAYTFEPHPIQVLRPNRAPLRLITIEQKLELFEQAGLDAVIVEKFDPEFALTTPEDFVQEILYERIRPVGVYVGYDFHFGRDRGGSMRLLTELGPKLGFAVTIIPEVKIDGASVNSTRIRELLGGSEIEEVGRMLGRPYSVRGCIVEGDRRGRTLGFPTANLAPENEILPTAGVYAGRLRFLNGGEPNRGAEFPAVTNVGLRPTFASSGSDSENSLQAEAHLLDFEGDVYGRRVELSFITCLRPEQRFSGPDALREQITADIGEARRILEVP
jgi:riboflavin kinase/FMN adenylyltransferase